MKRLFILICLASLFLSGGCSDSKTTSATDRKTCTICGGSGLCPTCLGQGHLDMSPNGTDNEFSLNCPTCQGSGLCWNCNGTGAK